MLYPSVDEIREKVDSKYATVILAAKRARDILDGAPPLMEGLDEEKAVSVAAYEIAAGYITPGEPLEEDDFKVYDSEFQDMDVFADVEAVPVEVANSSKKPLDMFEEIYESEEL